MIQLHIKTLEKKLEQLGNEFYQIVHYNELVDCIPKSTLTRDEINSLDSLFKIFKVASTKNETLNEKEYLLMMWITLGSLTECIMQLFLKVFYSDYKNNIIEKLEEVNSVNRIKLKEEINEIINEHYNKDPNNKGLKKSRENLKKELKNIIDKKFKEKNIETLTLGVLNDFYKKHVWSSDDIQDHYSTIDFIRKNRNCIHSTKVTKVDNKESLEATLKGYVKIIDSMYIRIPEVPWEDFE